MSDVPTTHLWLPEAEDELPRHWNCGACGDPVRSDELREGYCPSCAAKIVGIEVYWGADRATRMIGETKR